MEDSTQSIFRSAKRFFTGTAVSRLSGLFRDLAMAFVFGTQAPVAAFLVAFRLSHLLRRLLGEGALQTAFIPYFEKLRREDPLVAGTFFRNINAGLTLLLLFISFLSMAGIYMCLEHLSLSEGNREILWLTFLMMPGLLFICLFGLNASLLQCEKSFFTPSVAPVAFNGIWIIGVFCLWQWDLDAKTAMPWLALFIVCACMGQWLMTLPKTLKILKSFGFRHLFKDVAPFSKEVRGLIKPLCLGIVGVAASQINNAMDPIFARYADPQGPAFLWYAIRLQQLPLALFGIALSGAVLPPLSRAIKANDEVKYRHFLNFALSRSLALMLPITFAIFILAYSSIQLIYGHGDFSARSVVGTTQSLWGYGVGLIPMTFVLILAPAFYAQEDYKTPSMASLASVVMNILLNTVFVMSFGLGAASVALATSISAWFNVAILAHVLHKRIGSFVDSQFWKTAGKLAVVTSVGFTVMLALNWMVGVGVEGGGVFSQGFLGKLSLFSLQASICLVIGLLAYQTIKVKELRLES